MGCDCNKKKCGKSGSSSKDVAQLNNALMDLQDIVTELQAATKIFTCGHPILMISEAADVALFSVDTGLGSKCYDGWALCNGEVQVGSDGKDFTTPNLLDKFVVGAGSTYAVGATGGEATHILTEPELPAHSHAITDVGHTHDIQDPGHTHGMVQEPHNHAATPTAHTHAINITTTENGSHDHSTGTTFVADNTGEGVLVRDTQAIAGNAVTTNGAHTHSVVGSTEAGSGNVDIGDASISISNQNAATGIEETELATTGIQMSNTGENQAHNNLPPYYAVVYIIKL